MSITSITFYNYYHNGDLFVCKQFVQQFASQFSHLQFDYCHFNHPKTLQDLGIKFAGIPAQFGEKTAWSQQQNHLAINTWVGVYQAPCEVPALYPGGINLHMLSDIWNYLGDQLAPILGSKFQVSQPLSDYIPNIDYTQFDVSSVDRFVSASANKKVLICNGVAMSGQSFADNLSEMIHWFADRYPHLTFICTSKFHTDRNNVHFTDDICEVDNSFPPTVMYWNQNLTRCDLNEISYLSTHCDLIVGKNSGPFIYCLTKQNVNNSAKTFISFNNVIVDNLLYNISTPCTYIQHAQFDLHSISQLIDSKLCQL